MTSRIPRGDAAALARALVQVDSRNPQLVPGAPGEAAVARLLAEVLGGWGFDVEVVEAAPGRPNVIGRVGRAGDAPPLLFDGHVDVVGTEGMTHAPFAAELRDGSIHGRGAADMKGGVAAMCAAAARAAERGVAGEIVVAAVVDEEYRSAGTRALVERGVRAGAAVVTEPTGLAIMPAHKGFAWVEITVHGRAAHGSRWDLGVDAIRNAGLILVALDALDDLELPLREHALLGRGSLHASTIEGGTGWSTYPDRCVVRIERRTIPGETPAQAVREVEAAVARVSATRPAMRADVQLVFAQPPSDVPVEAPVVRALARALEACGEPVRIAGMSAWTDAALLNEAGIPAVCFGPGDMGLAHAAAEWIPVDEIERATEVLARLALDWHGGRGVTWRS